MSDFNAGMVSRRGRWGQIAGGGMRSNSRQPNQKPSPIAGYGEEAAVGFYQDAAREGVSAMGQQSAGDFRKAIGGYLGNLNAIGGLRSGAAQSGADEIMDTYSRNFANAASRATLDAIGIGHSAAESQWGRENAKADRKQASKAGKWGAVGTLLGAGVGLLGGRRK